MLHRTYEAGKRRHAWLWALLPLLLAAGLTVTALGRHVFDVDEADTMIGAGARHLGPYSPAEAVTAFISRWPDQAWGHVVVFSQWGRVVGWSELAIHTLPWLTGLLTLACVFRIGRALFSQRVAMTAMLLLSTSIVFLTYMHKARSYGLAMLFAAIVLWAYWRVALHPRPPGRGARALLVLGATGLLYSHYFAALLLPALALFHLFFVRKERRWWQPVALLGLATLLALPQVPDLLIGIEFNRAKEQLHASALHYPEVMSLFLRYLSNGLLDVRQPVSNLLALALPLPLLFYGRRSRYRRQIPAEAWYLLLTSILLLLLLLGTNEWLQVFQPTRIRYLAALWPPAVLLISHTFMRPSRSLQQRSVGLVVIVLIAFLGTRDFLSRGELASLFRFWTNVPVTIAATQAIAAEGSASGLLAIDQNLFHGTRDYEFYTGFYGDRRVNLKQGTASASLLEHAQGLDKVWLILRSSRANILRVPNHIDHFSKAGWFHCRSWQEDGVTMELLLSPFPAYMTNLARLQFENDIELFAPVAPELRDGLLRLRARLSSADETLLSRYSLALHVIDTLTGERVAQGDIGVGPGAVVPLCREIDISALPPGDYEVRVALYDWQTGARLPARDLETGETSDMHTLQRFRIG